MSTLRTRGIEIAFDEAGQGNPIVLLHGFPLNRSMWSEQVKALRTKYRVITPDLRGHGKQPWFMNPRRWKSLRTMSRLCWTNLKSNARPSQVSRWAATSRSLSATFTRIELIR
jgi:pimeloyl-ACP methyl ester carboxylesterase